MSWIANDVQHLIDPARAGDAAAVDALLGAMQDPVYGLAIRMLADPEDARDATQEILLRVALHLASFRGDSSFSTWAYRVAANHLLTARARRTEAAEGVDTFDDAAQQIAAAVAASAGRSSDDDVLIKEVKLFCTHGMLLCLDRPHRLAYILGEILELESEEGAAILEITAEAFRKRLSRARTKLDAFLRGSCGLVNRDCACRCATLVPPTVELGLIDPARLRYARHPTHGSAEQLREHIEAFRDAAALFRSQPDYAAPAEFARSMRRALADRGI